jgi:hypothetical protein
MTGLEFERAIAVAMVWFGLALIAGGIVTGWASSLAWGAITTGVVLLIAGTAWAGSRPTSDSGGRGPVGS